MIQSLHKKQLKVEIWSDVVCPFCYIGKRKFEQALEQFPNSHDIQIEWKSFQLDPEMKFEAGRSIHEVLAEKKGWSVERATQMNQQVTDMAKAVGLDYKFDKTIPANTLNAHRFAHLALKYGKQDVAEEKLFKAYFTEGRDINDKDELIELGKEIGLNADEVREMLNSTVYFKEVESDANEAQQLGVRGVPFFVLDRKYAVSGAQPVEVFTSALETAWKEFEKSNPATLNPADANSCSIEGDC